MATVCGGCLALMDAGAPIKAPVAGIAMGLVKEGDQFAILTDIAGPEDHYGDMDFKVAGTREGITALQMDIKATHITTEIMAQALEQAKAGRLHVLDKMLAALKEARPNISAFAPRIYTLRINRQKIGELIGPGGKVIRGIVEQTGAKIDVEDDGRVNVAAIDEAAANKALQMIKDLMAEAEIGKTYLGKVVRLALEFCQVSARDTNRPTALDKGERCRPGDVRCASQNEKNFFSRSHGSSQMPRRSARSPLPSLLRLSPRMTFARSHGGSARNVFSSVCATLNAGMTMETKLRLIAPSLSLRFAQGRL